MYATLTHSLFSSRRRAILTVVFWVLAAGLLASVAPSLDSVEDNESANFPPAASDSMQARDLTRTAFPEQTAIPAVIVVRGGDASATDEAVRRITTALSGPGKPSDVVGVISTQTHPEVSDDLVSQDQSAQLILAPITGSPSDDAFLDTVADVREIASDAGGGATVAVTGPAGIATDTIKVFSSGDKTLLFATILLVLIILLAIYRSPLMALVPLLAAGLAMRVAETTGALMADAGWFDINSQTASIMTVLLFGVGTDYALIITARYREALADQPDRYAAMQTAMRSVGETILSSASTVILAMLALLVAVSPSLRGFGPYLALGVAVMALVAFTFIPALILLFGRAIFWPSRARKAGATTTGRGWNRVADLVTTKPKKVIAVTIAGLALLSAGLIGYQQSFDFVSGFRIDTESAEGQTLLREHFEPGEVAPSTILIHSDQNLEDSRGALEEISRTVSVHDDVARIDAAQISSDGHTAAFNVVLDHDPYSPEALDAIGPLQTATQTAAQNAGLTDTTVLIGGETAQTADTRSALNRDTGYIVALVLLIVAGVLGLLLRSLLAPIYLVGTLVLSFLATLGATTFFTLTVLGDVGIGNRVTVYIFVFLVALGVDYNIFIMSRYKQELMSSPPVEAMHTAIRRTGGVVSSAGLILAATFSVLMTQPIRELFQFGFAMAFGILLDTFVIRPLLVPAIVTLLGQRSLWPSRTPAPETTESAAISPATGQ